MRHDDEQLQSHQTSKPHERRSRVSCWARPTWRGLYRAPAMALAYDVKRATRDVDARFVPHGIVLEEARRVAEDLGLPPWWLNEQASVYISGKDDPGKRRVFDHPGLRVMAASPEHVFAMKALAARVRDIDDLRLLAGMAKVRSSADALRICADFFPDEPVSQRSAAVLREFFD